MTTASPAIIARPRQPFWRVALSWLLPLLLLCAAFFVGIRAGRRGSGPAPDNPLIRPHEPGLLPPGGAR